MVVHRRYEKYDGRFFKIFNDIWVRGTERTANFIV